MAAGSARSATTRTPSAIEGNTKIICYISCSSRGSCSLRRRKEEDRPTCVDVSGVRFASRVFILLCLAPCFFSGALSEGYVSFVKLL